MLFEYSAEIEAILYSAKPRYLRDVIRGRAEKIASLIYYLRYIILLWCRSRDSLENLHKIESAESAKLGELTV